MTIKDIFMAIPIVALVFFFLGLLGIMAFKAPWEMLISLLCVGFAYWLCKSGDHFSKRRRK